MFWGRRKNRLKLDAVNRLVAAVVLSCLAMGTSMAQSSDQDKIVLETERPLLLEAIRLCSSASLKEAHDAVGAFSEALKQAGINPDSYDADLPAKGMLQFSAWGFDGDQIPDSKQVLGGRSFFVSIRMQESGSRTVTHCDVTDMNTNPQNTSVKVVEADWLDAISSITSSAVTTHTRQAPETATNSEAVERHFDLSNERFIQSIRVLRTDHKVELTMMRAGMK